MTASLYLTLHKYLLISLKIYLKRRKSTLTRQRGSPYKVVELSYVLTPSSWEITVHTASGSRSLKGTESDQQVICRSCQSGTRWFPSLCSQPPAPHNPELLPCAWGVGGGEGNRQEGRKLAGTRGGAAEAALGLAYQICNLTLTLLSPWTQGTSAGGSAPGSGACAPVSTRLK